MKLKKINFKKATKKKLESTRVNLLNLPPEWLNNDNFIKKNYAFLKTQTE